MIDQHEPNLVDLVSRRRTDQEGLRGMRSDRQDRAVMMSEAIALGPWVPAPRGHCPPGCPWKCPGQHEILMHSNWVVVEVLVVLILGQEQVRRCQNAKLPWIQTHSGEDFCECQSCYPQLSSADAMQMQNPQVVTFHAGSCCRRMMKVSREAPLVARLQGISRPHRHSSRLSPCARHCLRHLREPSRRAVQLAFAMTVHGLNMLSWSELYKVIHL